jgi:hypothetical protein
LSLSPILSYRIHLAPAAAREPRDWLTILSDTGLNIAMGTGDVPYGVAIVVPGMGNPATTNDLTDFGSVNLEGARRARDASLTEPLWRKCWGQWRSMENLAVFAPPDGDSGTGGWEWMWDIARIIAGRALATEPLPLDDALALFERIAKFVQRREKKATDMVFISGFVRERAEGRFNELREGITNKYYDAAYRRFNDGYRALRKNPEREAGAMATKAIAEFRKAFDTLPARFRDCIHPKRVERAAQGIREDLVSELSLLVKSREPKRDNQPRFVIDTRDYMSVFAM